MRKRVKVMLRESEEKFRSLAESAPNVIYILDLDGTIQYVNRAVPGLLPKNMIGKKPYDYADPQYKTLMKKAFEYLLQTGESASCVIRGVAPHGTTSFYDVQMGPIRRNGKTIAVTNILTDITERVQDKEELQYRLVFEKLVSDISTSFISLNMEEIDQAINEALENITEFTRVDEGSVFLFSDDMNKVSMTHNWMKKQVKTERDEFQDFDTQTMPWWMEKLKKAETVVVASVNDLPNEASMEKRILKSQGIRSLLDVPLVFQGKVIGFLRISCAEGHRNWTNDEVSLIKMVGQIINNALQRKKDEIDKQRLETQLQQAQKIEAIGTLAGGIAHDFNNILFGALGFSEMAEADVEKGTRAYTCLKQIKISLERAADLVKQILTFSRQTENERKPLLLQPVIKEALKLLRGSLPSTIEIRQNVNSDCGPVSAGPTQIHQIIMNLATNACHAMREQKGIIDVSLDSVEVGDEKAVMDIDIEPGIYAHLSVSDNGHGMDAETQERIFEPYFTTKRLGEGTGLGLATVHGIVKNNDGAIHIYSEPGKGTAFHIFFPFCALGEEKLEKSKLNEELRGSERLLFVDDEEQITLFAKMAFEDLGYDVHSHTNSLEALEAFLADPYSFDIVVTDQTMPNLTGGELAKEMLEIRPDLPIILCTGFSEILSKEKARKLGICEYISKPILTNELARAIRRSLDINPCTEH